MDELYDGMIVLCPKCKGRGKYLVPTAIENEFTEYLCLKCKGDGRLAIRLETINDKS